MKRMLIIGATSAIAQATARRFATAGDFLFLVARNAERLAVVARDLEVLGTGGVQTAILDVCDYSRHNEIIDMAASAMGGIDVVLIAHGTLPNQKQCEQSADLTRKEFETNALSTINLLTLLANHLEQQGSGVLAVIASVAGDRGRKSNYVYGAAKGAVSLFMQGLRNRLHASGVRVVTIKPGFVDTPMTAEFDKGLLWASPEVVARRIEHAILRKDGEVYIPWFWFPIMAVIKLIPETVFKRLSL